MDDVGRQREGCRGGDERLAHIRVAAAEEAARHRALSGETGGDKERLRPGYVLPGGRNGQARQRRGRAWHGQRPVQEPRVGVARPCRTCRSRGSRWALGAGGPLSNDAWGEIRALDLLVRDHP